MFVGVVVVVVVSVVIAFMWIYAFHSFLSPSFSLKQLQN